MREPESAVIQLNEATKLKKNGRSIKFTNNATNTNIPIDSWKFLEWDYGKESIKLPIQARGLFTVNDDTIAVRGYDKFFNVDEKPFTKEKEIIRSTTGPYDVTLKENGCIIFISGLKSGDIIVCSKHSTGDRDQLGRNHAKQGEIQLLEQLGKEKVSQLAKYLYEENLTVVAELCDDEFEEHVLPYPKDKSGLYVHGLNYNTILFNTVPIAQVNEFSEKWGFKSVQFLTFDDSRKLFTFLHQCSETGTYNGREVEGFVIRCHRDNQDFFFKYKFEQPYLLYRQFRECTKEYISGTPIHSVRIRKNKEITRKYLEFVEELFTKSPEFKTEFENGHGIIKVRQLFLENLHESNGMKLLELDTLLSKQMKDLNLDPVVKYVFVPVATIGCGKTTVFNTLSLLFPNWIHIQNDNIAKKAKLKITDLTLKALDNNPVVLFDRNNSASRERKQIFDTIDQKRHTFIDDEVEIRYIAVNFIGNDVSEKQLWDITFNRVKKRGDNHQSIKPDADEDLVKSIMKGFIQRFQPLDITKGPDSAFDHVINLKLTEQGSSSLENVKIIIDDMHKKFPDLIPNKPSEELINEKFNEALNYKPTFIKDMTNGSQKRAKDPTYYGISMNYAKIIESLTSHIKTHEQFIKLQQRNYVQDEFHVTLGHVASAKGEKKKQWKDLVSKLGPGSGEDKQQRSMLEFSADVKLLQFVINQDKLICIKVEIIKIYGKDGTILDIVPMNTHNHVTIGCFPPTKAFESNVALEELYREDSGLKSDGVYHCGNDTLEVINLKEEFILEYQKLFAAYQ
ncbi:LIG1 tRNA ligase [Candida maltosa Xu316]